MELLHLSEIINLNAPITDKTSYGIVALNVIDNIECGVFPINHVSVDNPSQYLTGQLRKQTFDPSLPSVRLFHQFSLAESIGKGKRIGWPIFELDRFSEKEICHINSCDELFVCSNWAKDVISSVTKNPVHIVPLGVDRNIFGEVKYTNNKYVFFSAGKWEVRKGQDQIVAAFNAAFNNTDNVELWMSMHNMFANDVVEKKKLEYLATPLGRVGKIKFVGPFKTQKDLARIMQMTSCGVFPSKAEGWGLETLEMMSCGKPVIVSNCTAHTEYCNKDNAILIDPTDYVDAYDGMWFFKQGKWAEIPLEPLIHEMKTAYKNNIQYNAAGIETAKKYSWKYVTQQIKEAIK